MNFTLSVTEKQKDFIYAEEAEVLFGGAAGGGKSYGQIADALLYALKYPKSKQLILRRSFAELDKSLIRTSLALYPREIYTFNASSHVGRFKNGSIIDFGYCATENDCYQYQSAEYDQIRFDELTHFTEAQYTYLISRLRGANPYPKQIKSSTNPGGVGHAWVKARFIDPAPPGLAFRGRDGMQRVFIPSLLRDNKFLSALDPDYEKRLEALPEKEKRALLFGDWNIFDGQYFSEFSEREHVISPFEIPQSWRKYRTIDYGLDRLVCLWIAMALGNGYNDINLHYGNWNVIVLPGWTPSDDRLMIMSSEANKNLAGNMFFNRVPLTVTNWVDHHTGNYIWNGRCRFGIGFGSYKHIILAVDSETQLPNSSTLK